jgi:hypothetical protein
MCKAKRSVVVEYDGEFPNLCSGTLRVTIDAVCWVFQSFCMVSGGDVTFDDDWEECVSSGEWSINRWPDGFPEDCKQVVLDAVNSTVEHGCCGGCV